MKQLCVALVLAAALFVFAGAVFFVRSSGHSPVPEGTALAEAQAASAALEEKLSRAMERLDSMETALSRLEGQLRARDTSTAESEEPPEEDTAAEEGQPSGKKGKLLASALKSGEAQVVKGLIQEVLQEERQERLREQKARMAERQREIEELSQGPYGQFNYRVNNIARKIGLSEAQQQRYYALLSDYSARIEEIRQGLDREDPVAYKSYRERKQQITDEFDKLVIQSLTPPQAQDYQGLSSSDRSPALENAGPGKDAMVAIDALGSPREAVRLFLGADAAGAAAGFKIESIAPAPTGAEAPAESGAVKPRAR